MALQEVLTPIVLIITITSVVFNIFNAYSNKNIGLKIAELQLNLKREMNGRYVTLQTGEDLRERIRRLEAHEDAN